MAATPPCPPTPEAPSGCLVCARDEHATPLLELRYRGARVRICPQHLPILIHDPSQLVGRLPGAENLRPADHKD